MGFSQEWEQLYIDNKQMSVWPWSDLVSYIYRYTKVPKAGHDINILELGCGAGANIKLFQSLHASYYAMDGSVSIVESLHKRYPDYANHIIVGDFTKKIPFDTCFDVIIDRASITHNTTIDIRRCIDLITNKLKPGGKFIGIDWFSINHDDYRLGEEIPGDVHTKYMGSNCGQFTNVGNVHFSDEMHLMDLFSQFKFEVLEEKKVNQFYPQKHQFASWNFVIHM